VHILVQRLLAETYIGGRLTIQCKRFSMHNLASLFDEQSCSIRIGLLSNNALPCLLRCKYGLYSFLVNPESGMLRTLIVAAMDTTKPVRTSDNQGTR